MKKRDENLALGPTAGEHGLSKFMQLPMLLGQPEDVVPRAFRNMEAEEQEHFQALTQDILNSYPALSNLQAAHMALASMVMEQSLAFARKRGLSDLSETNVQALEWARKVYNQNVNTILKDVEEPERESNWMRDLEEFELTRTTRPDGTVEEHVKGKKKLKLPDPKVIDVEGEAEDV